VSVNAGKFKVDKRNWYVRELNDSEEYWDCGRDVTNLQDM
jgi:hypothetical protein